MVTKKQLQHRAERVAKLAFQFRILNKELQNDFSEYLGFNISELGVDFPDTYIESIEFGLTDITEQKIEEILDDFEKVRR